MLPGMRTLSHADRPGCLSHEPPEVSVGDQSHSTEPEALELMKNDLRIVVRNGGPL